MSDVPENAQQDCPGTESDKAGKANACAGCPNQIICASGVTNQEDPAISAIAERLKDIDKKLLILSGKGGVGKSTVTNLLARSFAKRFENANFGVLDLDICGPSLPRMMGMAGEQVHQSGSGWSPIYIDDNLSLMSIGFLISSPDDAIIWRGPKKNGMIRQFLTEVDWGNLDCLLLDTPPGTSDEHISATNYLLKASKRVAALLVTTPQEVSLIDVRKEISFCRKLKIPIIGVVENMSVFICRKCHKMSEIFPAKTGGATTMCKEMNVEFLGSIPLDPLITKYCDEGLDFKEIDNKISHVLNKIVDRVYEKLDALH